jgi:hypothetical protein
MSICCGTTSGNGLGSLFRAAAKGKRGPRADNRRFLKALLWMARSGGRWRDFARAIGRLRNCEAALRSLDRDGGAGRGPCRPYARSRSGMADDRLNHRAGASAGSRRPSGKRGADAQGLGRRVRAKGAVDAALALAAGKPVNKKGYIPFQVVSPANIENFT